MYISMEAEVEEQEGERNVQLGEENDKKITHFCLNRYINRKYSYV